MRRLQRGVLPANSPTLTIAIMQKKAFHETFFVYRYAAPHGRDYGMTYCPTLRRQQRAQGRTAGPIEHEVLSFLDFDHERKIQETGWDD